MSRETSQIRLAINDSPVPDVVWPPPSQLLQPGEREKRSENRKSLQT